MLLERLRWWLAGILPRRLAIALGIRRLSPDRFPPDVTYTYRVPDLDTGGAFRPKFRPQDPAKDPREPGGGESSTRASEHGWNRATAR